MDSASARMLIEGLQRDAERVARRFGLRYKSIDAERANVTRRYGVCFSDGTIRIRLRHAVTGRPLKYSSLVNTLCHELAHLRHFNHGPRFKAFYFELLDFARANGIYRPGHLRMNVAPEPMSEPLSLERARIGQRATTNAGALQLPLFSS
jgi:hypothetical protein